MVFGLGRTIVQRIWGGRFERPCLEHMQPESTADALNAAHVLSMVFVYGQVIFQGG